MNYESLYVDPRGRTARKHFIGALIVLAVLFAFYNFLVTGRTAQWCMAVLIIPYVILHARRLHDMGVTAFLLVVPAALLVAMAWFHLYDAESTLVTPVTIAALAVAAAFSLWGVVGKGQAAANRFGAPAAA